MRSSAHGMTSPALESLVVSVESGQLTLGNSPSPIRGYNTMPLQVTGRSPTASIDTLDSLRFSYKVSHPSIAFDLMKHWCLLAHFLLIRYDGF